MYEKHIQDLKFKCDASACCPEALDAAIALMRAAEPKDAAAEREHCEIMARHLGTQQCLGVRVATVFESQRAAARAEVEAKYQVELACLRKDVDDWKRAAQTIERESRAALRTHSENEGRLQARIAELETRLQRAEAEATIAELEDKLTSSQAWSQEFKTKLTALREAAEYEYENLRTRMPDAANRLRRAIEASKK